MKGVVYIKANETTNVKTRRRKKSSEMFDFLIVGAKASWLKGTRVPRFINTLSFFRCPIVNIQSLTGMLNFGAMGVCGAVSERPVKTVSMTTGLRVSW